MSDLSFKFTLKKPTGDEVRRLRVSTSLTMETLRSTVAEWWPETDVLLQYTDDDGDNVTFSTEPEWRECIAVLGRDSVVRITVVPNVKACLKKDRLERQARREAKEKEKEVLSEIKRAAKADKKDMKREMKEARRMLKAALRAPAFHQGEEEVLEGEDDFEPEQLEAPEAAVPSTTTTIPHEAVATNIMSALKGIMGSVFQKIPAATPAACPEPNEEDVSTLAAIFPTHDRETLVAALKSSKDVRQAIEKLLC
eukprot:PhF_6_TR11050/c2_g1_i1/m.17934